MSRTALLLTALVACGSSPPQVGPSNKAPTPSYEASLDDPLGFLPADSEVVFGIDAVQIRKTAVWTQLGPKVEKLLGNDLVRLRTACGFDPMQTVERISVGLSMRERDVITGVVVVRGVGAGVLGCVRTRFGKTSAAGTVTEDKGVVLLGRPDEREKSAWTLIGSTLIVQIDPHVGHDTMAAVLASGSPLRTSHAFMELYSRLERGASMWGVVNGKTKLLDELAGAGMRPVTVDGTLTMSDRVVIAGRATFADADTAAKVDALMKQSLATASKFAEHAESRQEGTHVIVGMSVSSAQLEMVLGFL